MTVRVKYRSMELTPGETETFPEADAYEIHKDHTLVLLCDGETVGAVHPERWASVVVENENANEERT